MNNFTSLKKQLGTVPKQPLHLSDWKQPCDHCERDTGTTIKFMRAGYGNACAVCGRLRRGKPYLSKAEFNTLKPDAAKGGIYDGKNS
jgi:hypothetical protein